jgi:polyhydroxybutyrate depolymerase
MGFTKPAARSRVRHMKMLISILVLAMALGCGSSDESNGAGGTGGQVFSANPPLTIGGDERPADVEIPNDYDPTVSYPLLIVLHGFGADGRTEAVYLQLFNVVDEKQFVLVFPDGTLNQDDQRFWNATPACCDPTDSVDDVAYLSGLIEAAKQTYNIDEKRVYLMGHSNGGFMSFTMACEASELITAIVSLAGSTFEDPADCAPAALPVSVLSVHGTADGTIEYDGGATGWGAYPGALETVERFATSAGCDTGSPTVESSVDLVPALDGAETDRVGYSTGCDEGIDAGLWTINDGPHIPFFSSEFANMTTDWLFRHSR